MKKLLRISALSLFVIGLFGSQSCKPKKVLVNPAVEVERDTRAETPPVVQETKPATQTRTEPTPVSAPNYNFRNIQFEFDSQVLKTDSYAVLDQISREMKKDPAVKFLIDGHASIEGSAAHNMALSVDRANAVKLYLVNSGIKSDNLITKGYGATKPTATNDNESGRALNRRVEIRVSK